MNRRTFLFASSGAALGSLVAPGWAIAEEGEASPYAASGLVTGTPKALRYKEVPGFLSAGQIAPHHNAHYGGALKAFTGVEAAFESSYASGKAIDPAAFDRMKQLQSSRGNSVLLHELYFDGMALGPTAPPEGLRNALDKRFGSVERWAADFVASANTAAGWALLVVHPVNGRLYNVVSDEHAQGPLWLSAPLVVLDTYEHAFYVDYQNRKSEYVEKFLGFTDWAEAERRYRRVVSS
jgi:Fe-Mn family superoxide dismutase